ncbi:transcription factor bHLH143 [Ziziphus jujuba]|uniref:Transcription factor bHLH143 n=1 Tax=Ziziphus jujuba TaxID=326968 RepID=A0ABM3IV99_ZIZJJ|nr:transcription factor bHLH143 [Ziziphus jujuba]
MVKANESWLHLQHSSWQLPQLNCMSTLLEQRQQQCLPSHTDHGTCTFPAHVELPESTDPGLQRFNNEQKNEAHDLLRYLPPHLRTSLSTPNPDFNGKQSAFSCGLEKSAVPNTNSVSCQRGLLIFDQSENHTRLIYNSVFPPIQNPCFASAKLNHNYDDLYKVGHAVRVDQNGPTKYVSHEEFGKNHMADEESEMHEDTEEINALLYSDDDGDGDDDYSEDDDEVRSTGNSPLEIKEVNGYQEEVEVLTKEVTSYDGPNKRQKLLNGGYNKSSPTDTDRSVKLDRCNEYDNDVESGRADSHNPGDGTGFILGKMQSKKEKIREILKVLESIIPGAKGKDALIVIDEAIDYLKSMKLKAENLGMSFH